MADHRLINRQGDLLKLVDELRHVDAYAIDTEFHRERTYFAQLALVQIAWEDGLVLLDPLALDLEPLSALFCSPSVAVMHAARQDLEVLERACGTIPEHVFDTQVAAGFLGYTSPSLATLLERELSVMLPKADRLTDWLQRPLSAAQLTYAAADVANLLALKERLERSINELDRAAWLAEAMADLMAEPRGARDPAEAWRRIKELRNLRGSDAAIARAIAGWRESAAIELDITPRFVLSDLGVVGVAVAKPRSVDDLRKIRGVDGRSLRPSLAQELVDAVQAAMANPPAAPASSAHPELPNELKPAVPLVSAWVGQLARDLKIELAMLATRSDLEALLRGDPEARLAQGWRAGLVGEPIRRLLAGEVALAFERSGGLVLVPRSASERNA